MDSIHSSSSGSLFKQLMFVFVATLVAAGLGYLAANGVKTIQAPSPSQKQSNVVKIGNSTKANEPCSDCEQRNLPTP